MFRAAGGEGLVFVLKSIHSRTKIHICTQKYTDLKQQFLDLSCWWKSLSQFGIASLPGHVKEGCFLKVRPLNSEVVLGGKSTMGCWATFSQKRQGKRP